MERLVPSQQQFLYFASPQIFPSLPIFFFPIAPCSRPLLQYPPFFPENESVRSTTENKKQRTDLLITEPLPAPTFHEIKSTSTMFVDNFSQGQIPRQENRTRAGVFPSVDMSSVDISALGPSPDGGVRDWRCPGVCSYGRKRITRYISDICSRSQLVLAGTVGTLVVVKVVGVVREEAKEQRYKGDLN